MSVNDTGERYAARLTAVRFGQEVFISCEDDPAEYGSAVEYYVVIGSIMPVVLDAEDIHRPAPEAKGDRQRYVLIHVEPDGHHPPAVGGSVGGSVPKRALQRASSSARVNRFGFLARISSAYRRPSSISLSISALWS